MNELLDNLCAVYKDDPQFCKAFCEGLLVEGEWRFVPFHVPYKDSVNFKKLFRIFYIIRENSRKGKITTVDDLFWKLVYVEGPNDLSPSGTSKYRTEIYQLLHILTFYNIIDCAAEYNNYFMSMSYFK